MTSFPCDFKVLKQLVAVNLDVTIWTARRKLTAADFNGVELPPEELASWGSKKICDPESLRVFSKLKSRATSHLDKIGVRFLGGWAIPEDQAQAISEGLAELKGEFLAAKDGFLNSYDQAVQSWVARHPGWEQLLSNSTVSGDYVRSRLDFNWQFYKVSPPDRSQKSLGDLTSEVEKLGETLFGEISKKAKDIWGKIYAGKTEVSHRALSPLKAMHQKLIGLSFLEPRVVPVADLIETALGNLPKRGKITGSNLVLLQGLVSMLGEPKVLMEHGQKVLEGISPSTIISNLSPMLGDLGQLKTELSAPTHNNSQTTAQKYLDSLGLW